MTYTNENATQYDGGRTDVGVIEKEIGIVSPNGLVTINNIDTFNIEGINGTSQNKQLATVNKAGGTDVTFRIALLNNTGITANNIKILGHFPTTGEFVSNGETLTNTLETTLKSGINANNATVYYSANSNATENIDDTNNGWKTNIKEVTNPKTYLIVINSLNAESNFDASYTVTLPRNLSYDLTSYTGYKVFYNEASSQLVDKTESTLVGITTGEGIKIETTLVGKVGNDTLQNGDTVRAGEVIRYTITVKNNGTQTLKNVVLKAQVPEGTVVVVPEEGTAYTGTQYYIERPDITEFTQTIETLESGQTYVAEYEIRVKMDITDGAQISNKANVTYGDQSVESNTLDNKLSSSNIRVTIKKVTDESAVLIPGASISYVVFVENLSNQNINNLKLKIDMVGQTLRSIINEEIYLTNVPEQIEINEIPANGIVYFKLKAAISKEDIKEISTVAYLTDSNGNVYRSNKDIQQIEVVSGKITLTSPTDGQHVNIGDEIRYIFAIENTGTNIQIMNVQDTIPSELEIKEIYVDGKLTAQTSNIFDTATFFETISNDLDYMVTLGANEKAEIVVVTNVKEIEEQFEIRTISNFAKLLLAGDKELASSSEVTHILNGNTSTNINNVISGIAWLDKNQNGQRDPEEELLPNVTIKLLDVSTNKFAINKDGQIAETHTNERGEYSLTKLNDGEYIVLFEYDMTQYEPTIYMKEGVGESQNSNVVLKTVNIDGVDSIFAVTDTINLTKNISNINIGLKEILIYDLELNKYVSRIVVQNDKGTKAYNYEDSAFEKVEIRSKDLAGSLVIIEYTIKVKNAGEIAGYVTSIRDYLPSGLEFSSDLNSNWYLSGTDLYTKSLADVRLEPGETRDIKLILTKTMTEDNVGRINNRAEIAESYNELGKLDVDSTNNNQSNTEDDLGAADVLIGISTGGRTIVYTLLVMINIGLIGVAIYLIFIKNRNNKLVERR